MKRIVGLSFCILLILTANITFSQSWKTGKIVYQSHGWEEGKPGMIFWLVIMNADGSDESIISNCWYQEGDKRVQLCASPFSLSPDCEKGALRILTGDNFDIWDLAIFDIDSRKLVNLTNGKPKGCGCPRWSPDGKQIVFDSDDGIGVINSDGTNIKIFGEGDKPDWSPDGQEIAFVRNEIDIYIMDANGKKMRNVITADVKYISSLRWSPDGKMILFAGYDGESNTRLYVMDANGDNLKLLIKVTNYGLGCGWSPNGEKIAYSAKAGADKNCNIWVMNPDGSDIERLTDSDVEESVMDWKDPASFGINLLNSMPITWGEIKINHNR